MMLLPLLNHQMLLPLLLNLPSSFSCLQMRPADPRLLRLSLKGLLLWRLQPIQESDM
jgi:hypothetical protein